MSSATRRILLVTGVMAVASAALATPRHMETFKRIEKPARGSHLHKAKCLTCHAKASGGKDLNPYGRDFKKHGANEEAMRNIRPLDSDSDAASNADEIAAGTLPGNPESTPPSGNDSDGPKN